MKEIEFFSKAVNLLRQVFIDIKINPSLVHIGVKLLIPFIKAINSLLSNNILFITEQMKRKNVSKYSGNYYKIKRLASLFVINFGNSLQSSNKD